MFENQKQNMFFLLEVPTVEKRTAQISLDKKTFNSKTARALWTKTQQAFRPGKFLQKI